MIALVDKKQLEHAPAREVVAAVLRQHADEAPEHYGSDANLMYHRWLIRRSELTSRAPRYIPPVLAQS